MTLRDVLAEIVPAPYAWCALGLLFLSVLILFMGWARAEREGTYDPLLLNRWWVGDGLKFVVWLGMTFGLNVVVFSARQASPEWASVADIIGNGGWGASSAALAWGWLNDIKSKGEDIFKPQRKRRTRTPRPTETPEVVTTSEHARRVGRVEPPAHG